MDLICQVCGEPWDIYSLQSDMSREEAATFKAGGGCPCCDGVSPARTPDIALKARVLHEVLGEDLDGIAAELSDGGW